jgi:hypothetical protein
MRPEVHVLALAAALVLASGVATAINRSATDNAIPKVEAAMHANIERDLAPARTLWGPLIYEGAGSQIVAISDPEVVGADFEDTEVRFQGIGKTKGGHYFSFWYVSNILEDGAFDYRPCLDSGCRQTGIRGELTPEEAESWALSYGVDDKRIHEIFGQDAAPAA